MKHFFNPHTKTSENVETHFCEVFFLSSEKCICDPLKRSKEECQYLNVMDLCEISIMNVCL